MTAATAERAPSESHSPLIEPLPYRRRVPLVMAESVAKKNRSQLK